MLKREVLAREVVRRSVGIGRGAGHSIIMIAEFGGLVNGVVPVLHQLPSEQSVRVRRPRAS